MSSAETSSIRFTFATPAPNANLTSAKIIEPGTRASSSFHAKPTCEIVCMISHREQPGNMVPVERRPETVAEYPGALRTKI
jgi:hypothetical protein